MRQTIAELLRIADKMSKREDVLDQVHKILEDMYYEVPDKFKSSIKTAMDLLEE